MSSGNLHDVRNLLSIAVANLEAFIDGKLEPSAPRMQVVLEALQQVDTLLDDLAGSAGRSDP